MADPSNALVPVAPASITVPPPPSFGFAFTPPQQQGGEEPSFLWRTVTRHWKLLVFCALLSGGIAFVVGKTYGKPTWQAETTLLYQQVPLTPQQLAVYQDPPNITTLANMVCDPGVLDPLMREFSVPGTVEEFAVHSVRVNQPSGTQLITISLSWTERDTAAAMLTRFADLFTDFVVVNRKQSIMRKAVTATRQALANSKNEMARLQRRIQELGAQLARTGQLPEADPDGALAIRKGTLMDDIKKAENQIEELIAKRAKLVMEIEKIAPHVRAGALPQTDLRDRQFELEICDIQLRQAREKIADAREEIRKLPIILARGKLVAEEARVKDYEEQINRLEGDLVNIAMPGGPPAKGLLEGMDAHELSIYLPVKVGDKPTASTKKSVAVYTFLALMGCVLALALAFDYFVPLAKLDPKDGRTAGSRGRPVDDAPDRSMRARVVQYERGQSGAEKVTITQVESPRLTVRIDQWIKAPDPSSLRLPALTIGEDGQIEDPTVKTETEANHMADRIHQWLERGPFDPPPP